MSDKKTPKVSSPAGEPELDLEELAQTVVGFQLASGLPDEIVAQITGAEVRTDKRGREALFTTIEGDFGRAVVKYTKIQAELLAKCLKQLGFGVSKPSEIANIVPTPTLKMKRFKATRTELYPRHYPVKVVK